MASRATVKPTAPVNTKARIVVAGGGAAGLAAASRLAAQLAGVQITVVDDRKEHWYQPGFTLVASGIKPMGYVVSQTADYIPKGVEWVPEALAEIDPEGRKVVTASGRALPYDFLIADTGGVGVFGRPLGEMKCAGAPLKYTFITDDHLRRRGHRGKAELLYHARGKVLFSVPIVAEKVRELFQDRGVKVRQEHVLKAVDLGKRIATFQTPNGPMEQNCDFIIVVPPMRAPQVVKNSPLPWSEGPWAADGWMEVDRETLRHKRYPNVFGVGDIAGVPKSKTAACWRW